MISRNGKELKVGDNVIILQTPVVGQHTFVDAQVVGFTEKMVKVEYLRKSRYGGSNLEVHTRYPAQVITYD